MDEGLDVCLLGWPEVRWVRAGQRQTLTFPSLKSQAILYYLLATRRPVARERLMALLWPDVPPKRAQTSLRTALYQLQRTLPEGALHADRRCVMLADRYPWETDVDRLLRLLAQPLTPSRLRAVQDLYRGDFLEGFHIAEASEFAHWRSLEAEHLRVRLLEWLHAGVERAFHRGLWREAEQVLRFMVRLEPWREDFHARLMETLAWQGRVAAALKHYETCHTVLQEEVGLSPGPPLQQLVRRLRALHDRPPVFRAPPLPGPLVGREVEMARLSQALQAARFVVLVGPGGVGKTHLMLAFAHRHRRRFLDGVYYLDVAEDATLDYLVVQLASCLRVPLRPGTPPEDRVLAFLQERETLLLLDLTGVPEGMEALLSRWLPRAPRLWVLVAAPRPLNVHAAWHLPLAGLPGPPEDEVPPASYPAGRLFQRAAQRLGHRLPDTPGSHRAVAQICRQLDGLPMALEMAAAQLRRWNVTTLARMLEQNLDLLAASWPDRPSRHRSVRALFQHTWCALPPELQQAFVRLAVFRGVFSARDAQRVLDVGEAVLRDLVVSGLVRRVPGDGFVLHQVLRAFAREGLEALPDGGRVWQERHVHFFFDLLEDCATRGFEDEGPLEGRLPDVRAAWLWAAQEGLWPEVKRVLAPWHRFHERRGWYAEGVRLFQQAVAALRPHRDRDPEGWARLLLHTAALLLRNGRLAEALPLAEEGVQGGALGPDAPARLFGLNVLGVLYVHTGDFARGIQVLQEAVERARRVGASGERIKGLVNLGSAYLRAGRYQDAIPVLKEGLALAREVGDVQGEGFFLINLGNGLVLVGAWEEGRRYLEAARRWGREHRVPNTELHALISLASLEGMCGGSGAQVAAYAQEAVALAREMGERQAQARGMAWLAWAYHAQQQPDKAWEVLEEAWRLLDPRSVPTRLYLVLQAACLWAREGKREQAVRWAAYVGRHPAAEGHLVDRAAQLLRRLGTAAPEAALDPDELDAFSSLLRPDVSSRFGVE